MKTPDPAAAEPLFSLTFEMGLEDQVTAAQSIWGYRYRHWKAFCWFIFIAGIVLVIFASQSEEMNERTGLCMILGLYGALMLCIFRLQPSFMTRRNFRKYGGKPQVITIHFTEKGFQSKVPGKGEDDCTWAVFIEALEVPEGLLFFINPYLPVFLPARVFDSKEHYESFVAFAKRHISRWLRHRMPKA